MKKELPDNMFFQKFSYKKSSLGAEIWLHLNDQHRPPRWPKKEENNMFYLWTKLLIYLKSDMARKINLTALHHFNLIFPIRPTIFVKHFKVKMKVTIIFDIALYRLFCYWDIFLIWITSALSRLLGGLIRIGVHF